MNQIRLNRLDQLSGAPRCGAKTRRGTACRCPAMRDRKRCRLHGGKSTGAPHGAANGNYTDGHWTREVQEERNLIRSLLAATRQGKS